MGLERASEPLAVRQSGAYRGARDWGSRVPEEKRESGWLTRRRETRRLKRERKGPSAEAQHEHKHQQRNTEKVFDPTPDAWDPTKGPPGI